MPTLTGVVLTEIVGRDVISWRVTPDTFHELTYSVDTAEVPGVVVLGMGMEMTTLFAVWTLL